MSRDEPTVETRVDVMAEHSAVLTDARKVVMMVVTTAAALVAD